nr:hypothetical protein [Tanacetum cinerariifolium]
MGEARGRAYAIDGGIWLTRIESQDEIPLRG